DAQSLSTILSTSEQRSQLTLLLANCIASMRKTIVDTFDPRYAGLPSDSRYDNLGSSMAAGSNDNDNDKEKEVDQLREEAEKRIKELSEPKVQELKRAGLSTFDVWRDKVVARVGEVVSSKQEAEGQVDGAKAQSADTPAVTKVGSELLNDEGVKKQEPMVDKLADVYPLVETPLAALDESKKRLILQSLLLLILSLGTYSAYSRTLMLYFTRNLKLPIDSLVEYESNVAQGLLHAVEMNAEKETEQKIKEGSNSRKWKVGLAAVAGAAIVGITGGLAAPVIAAGVGTVAGGLGLAETAAAGYLGAVAGSELLIGSIFGAYGGRMTGKMVNNYAREVEDFSFLPLHKWRPFMKDKEVRKLRVAIGISGWLTDKADVVSPWRVLSPTIEGFALKYEMEALLELGNALTLLLKSVAWSYAKKTIIRNTIFAVFKEALWPLSLVKVAEVVDNPFSVAKARSDKAGELLADALINKVQGERPVSLVGYSLGARVIYTCLKTLADRKAFGLLENVVLLGCPASSDSADWRKMRAVVSGRLVNVYSENDYLLAFLYRTSSLHLGVAGLRKTEFVKGIENVDVSDVVSGHLRYRYLTGAILRRIGFEDIDMEEVGREEAEMQAVEEVEKREAEEHEQEFSKDGKPVEEEAGQLKKEVKKKNEQS
ncbi:DUF726-domain-containing protein, partial [Rhizodiscina lignyota]